MQLLASFIGAVILVLFPKALPAAEPEASPKLELTNPFFAFDNGTGRGQLACEQQAEMLQQLGYDGIGYTGTGKIPEMLAALDARGLKMFSTYIGANVDPDQPPYDPGLPEAIKQFKGHGTAIWLFIRGGQSSANTSDERAVAIVREIADMAAKSELPVVLYPHVGFYVARTEDALRIVEKVDRPNVGVAFNLCHFLKLDDEENLQPLLKRAMPHLRLVSINGADGGQTNAMGWDRLIQTLDRGDFDVYGVLKTLRQLGYEGPIGLQCYAIKGDIRENLARSIGAWRKFEARMRDDD